MLGLSSCAGVTEKGEGPMKVNDLISRIERVYVESELAQQKASAAIGTLENIVASDFGGDPVQSFSDFVAKLDISEKQTTRLGEALDPMKDAAEPIFERWNEDVEKIASDSLRRRSAARLEKTRGRFEAMTRSVDPAMEALTKLNQGMRDLALFLGNDLNHSSLVEVRADVRELGTLAQKIEDNVADYLVAAKDYMDRSALPSIEPTQSGDGKDSQETEAPSPKR